MMDITEIAITEVASHRNGVSGAPFNVIKFRAASAATTRSFVSSGYSILKVRRWPSMPNCALDTLARLTRLTMEYSR